MLCRLTAVATGAAAIVLEVAEDSPLAEHPFSTRAEIRNRLKKFMEQCRFIIIISIPRAFGRGTNSNERFSKPLLHEIMLVRGYTTKHGEGSCKFFLVLDSIIISVSSAFSSTNKWYYESVH